MSNSPKKDILSVIFCDILGENCPIPELSCEYCEVFIKYIGFKDA